MALEMALVITSYLLVFLFGLGIGWALFSTTPDAPDQVNPRRFQ